jgi:hypothetical protein
VVPDDLLTLSSLQLCNVLFTRELQRRLDVNADTKGVIANCFSPGLIVGTGLFRDQNQVFTKVQKPRHVTTTVASYPHLQNI